MYLLKNLAPKAGASFSICGSNLIHRKIEERRRLKEFLEIEFRGKFSAVRELLCPVTIYQRVVFESVFALLLFLTFRMLLSGISNQYNLLGQLTHCSSLLSRGL